MKPSKYSYILNAGVALLLWTAVAAVVYLPMLIGSEAFETYTPISAGSPEFYLLVGLAMTSILYPVIRATILFAPNSVRDIFIENPSENQITLLYDHVTAENTEDDSEDLSAEEKRQRLFDWADGSPPRLYLAPENPSKYPTAIVKNADKVDNLLATSVLNIEEVDKSSSVPEQLDDLKEAIQNQFDDDSSSQLDEELSDILNCNSNNLEIKGKVRKLNEASGQVGTVNNALETISNVSLSSLEQELKTKHPNSQGSDRISAAIYDIDNGDGTGDTKELETKVAKLLRLLENAVQEINKQKEQKKEYRIEANQLSESVESISRELDMDWIENRTSGISARNQDSHRGEGLSNSEPQVKNHKLLSKAVVQGVVGEMVIEYSAKEIFAEKSLKKGSAEYELLDALRNASPSEPANTQLEQTVEKLQKQRIILDSIDTSISESDVRGVANEVESQIAKSDVGQLQDALSSHISRTVRSVQNAHADNPVPAYIAFRHLSKLRDVLRSIGDGESPVDLSRIESKAAEIDELSQQFSNITSGQRIPDHFLTVVDSLKQEAMNAKQEGRNEYAEGIITSTISLQDGIIDLYKNRRLRKKLVQM